MSLFSDSDAKNNNSINAGRLIGKNILMVSMFEREKL